MLDRLSRADGVHLLLEVKGAWAVEDVGDANLAIVRRQLVERDVPAIARVIEPAIAVLLDQDRHLVARLSELQHEHGDLEIQIDTMYQTRDNTIYRSYSLEKKDISIWDRKVVIDLELRS